MKKKAQEYRPHERYNYLHPLLRELVRVHVDAVDGTKFDALQTRVPGIGEDIFEGANSYRVLRVQHSQVDDDGRALCGWHAFIDAELQPEEIVEPKKRKRKGTKALIPTNSDHRVLVEKQQVVTMVEQLTALCDRLEAY